MHTRTKAEHFLIWKRRQDLSLEQAAIKLRINRHTAQALAKGRPIGRVKLPDAIKRTLLDPAEECYLHRVRAGKTQVEVAKALSVSKQWIIGMERGRYPCDKLLAYWRG